MADAAEKTAAPATQVQRPTKAPEAAGAKVTVYCCLPNGLDLRVFRMVERSEPVLGGGFRDYTIAEQDGMPIHINGGGDKPTRLDQPRARHRVVLGFGVTEGVDKDTWERWLADNKQNPIVQKGYIYAAEKREYGDAEAEERGAPEDPKSASWTGLGAMLTENDPRRPRPGANLQGLKKFAEEAA